MSIQPSNLVSNFFVFVFVSPFFSMRLVSLVLLSAIALWLTHVAPVSAGDEMGCAVCVILLGLLRQGRLASFPQDLSPQHTHILCKMLPETHFDRWVPIFFSRGLFVLS